MAHGEDRKVHLTDVTDICQRTEEAISQNEVVMAPIRPLRPGQLGAVLVSHELIPPEPPEAA